MYISDLLTHMRVETHRLSPTWLYANMSIYTPLLLLLSGSAFFSLCHWWGADFEVTSFCLVLVDHDVTPQLLPSAMLPTLMAIDLTNPLKLWALRDLFLLQVAFM